MPHQKIFRLPRRALAVARKVIILMLVSFPIWARQVAISLPIWARHYLLIIRRKITLVKFGWVNGWTYRKVLDPGGGVSFAHTIARRRVNSEAFKPNPRTAVILAFGQSNIANEGDPSGRYTPGPGVYNFNFLNGRCYVAKCPLLGASGNYSSFVTRLGDMFVLHGIYDRVLLVSIGYGGTSMADWAPGGLANFRLMIAIELLRQRGIVITHAIFQQGESEGIQAKPDGSAWVRNFDSMVKAVRLFGMEAPIYVAQCSLCRCDPNEIIRAAQRSVVDPAKSIFAGPDTDTIGLDERWDDCHFSITGLEKAAQLWFNAVTRHQSASTSPHDAHEPHASSPSD